MCSHIKTRGHVQVVVCQCPAHPSQGALDCIARCLVHLSAKSYNISILEGHGAYRYTARFVDGNKMARSFRRQGKQPGGPVWLAGANFVEDGEKFGAREYANGRQGRRKRVWVLNAMVTNPYAEGGRE